MKNLTNPKILLFCLTAAVVLNACKKENLDDTITIVTDQTVPPRILGEWEMYKLEKQELQVDSITLDPPQAYHSMVWFDQTSPMANEMTMGFYDDYSFQDFYAEVPVFSGVWSETNDSTYSLTFTDSQWSGVATDYTVNMHCANTMSVEYLIEPPAGNHEFQDADWHVVQYYRKPGTTECDDLIDYYTE